MKKKPFTQARQTHQVCSITLFFAPVFGRSKCGGQTLRLTGFCPQNETRSLGFTCHRWGVSFRFGSPVFPFLRWTLIRIKQSLPPSFYFWLVKSLATKQVCDFQRFRIVLLVSLHDVKNALRSPQNRSKLSA